MKVIAFNGSTRPNGVTALAIELVAAEMAQHGVETDIFNIGAKGVAGCTDCLKCRSTLRCVMNDRVNEAIERLAGCEGIILAAPTYFCGIPGPAKAFFDRLFYATRTLRMCHFKAGTAITVLRRSGGVTALAGLYNYFLPSRIVLVPNQYHNMLFGQTREQAMADAEGLQTMRLLGRHMAWLTSSLAQSRDTLPPPEFEERTRTSFPNIV